MIPAPAFMENPAYVEYLRLLRRLHVLESMGLDETEEAEFVRDQMDRPWAKLSEAERNRARGLSADLYTIGTERPTGINQELKITFSRNYFSSQTSGDLEGSSDDWEGALAELRGGLNGVVPAFVAAFFRGRFWANLGDRESALLFMEEACRLNPKSSGANLGYVQCLGSMGKVKTAARRIISSAASEDLVIPEFLLVSAIRCILSRHQAVKSRIAAIEAKREAARAIAAATRSVVETQKALEDPRDELRAAKKQRLIQKSMKIIELKARVNYERNSRIFARALSG